MAVSDESDVKTITCCTIIGGISFSLISGAIGYLASYDWTIAAYSAAGGFIVGASIGLFIGYLNKDKGAGINANAKSQDTTCCCFPIRRR